MSIEKLKFYAILIIQYKIVFVKGGVMKVGVADYGLNVWFGALYDFEERLNLLQQAGYDGLERISPNSAEDVLQKAAALKRHGMDFSTIRIGDVETCIKWIAAMGKSYIWADQSPHANDLDKYCQTVNYLSETCERYGIVCAVHNHLGSLVETQEQLEYFLEKCPKAGLVFDLGHMAVAGGDVMEIAKRYYERIVALHLKEWTSTDPSAENWWDRGFFCGLKQGNYPVDNESVVKYVLSRGYDKWIFIEHDTHKREPLQDLKESREILRSWAFKYGKH